jgi:hypothetical protein
MDELTRTELAAGLALARTQTGPDGVVDPAMPGLPEAQALLATRALLGCSEALAGQLVAAARGQEFDDVLQIGPDGVARPAPISAPVD